MSEVLAVRPPVPSALRAADIGGKAGLLLLLVARGGGRWAVDRALGLK